MGKHRGSRQPPGPKKPPLTHFLCLPLVTEHSKPQLERSLQQFQNAVASNGENGGNEDEDAEGRVSPPIHPKAIRPVGALHCTLGVMSLNDDQLLQATSFLESLDVTSLISRAVEEKGTVSDQASTAAPSSSLVIDLKGLESMHEPEKTSILYSAPSGASERLYPFCLAVQELFKDKGLLVEDNRKLKLHATIVNTIYAKGKKMPPRNTTASSAQQADGSVSGHGPNANAALKIDARTLLDKYKDFIWAEKVALDRLAICEMGAKKATDADGKVIAEQYTEVASIALPS